MESEELKKFYYEDCELALVSTAFEHLNRHKTDFEWLDKLRDHIISAIETAFRREMYSAAVKATLAFFPYLQAAGQYDLAAQYLVQAQDASVKEQDNLSTALVLKDRGIVAMLKGNLEAASDLIRPALQMVSPDQDSESFLAVHMAYAVLLDRMGRIDEALAIYEAVLAHVRASKDEAQIIRVLLNLGALELESSSTFDKARLHLEEGIARARKTRNLTDLATMLLNLSVLEFYQGNSDRELELLEEALQIAQAMKPPHKENIAFLSTNLAESSLDRGELERADKYIAQGLIAAKDLNLADRICSLTRLRGELSLQRKDMRQAEEDFQRCLELAEAIGQQTMICAVNWSMGNLYLALGKLEQAKSYYRTTRECAEEVHEWYFLSSRCQIARVDVLEGHTQSALEELLQVKEAALTSNLREVVAASSFALAQAYLATGSEDMALASANESEELYRSIKHRMQHEVRRWREAVR